MKLRPSEQQQRLGKSKTQGVAIGDSRRQGIRVFPLNTSSSLSKHLSYGREVSSTSSAMSSSFVFLDSNQRKFSPPSAGSHNNHQNSGGVFSKPFFKERNRSTSSSHVAQFSSFSKPKATPKALPAKNPEIVEIEMSEKENTLSDRKSRNPLSPKLKRFTNKKLAGQILQNLNAKKKSQARQLQYISRGSGLRGNFSSADQNVEQYDSKPNHLPLSSCADNMHKFSSLRMSFTAGNSPTEGDAIASKIEQTRTQSKSYHNPSSPSQSENTAPPISSKPKTVRAQSYRRSLSRTKVIGLDTPTPAPQSRAPNITFDMRSSQTGTLSAKNQALLSQLSPGGYNLNGISRMVSLRGRPHILFSGKSKFSVEKHQSSSALSPFSVGSGSINKIDPLKVVMPQKKPDFQSSPSSHMKSYFQAKEPNQTHKKPEVKQFELEDTADLDISNRKSAFSPSIPLRRNSENPSPMFDAFKDLRALHNRVVLKSPLNLSKSDQELQTSRSGVCSSRSNRQKPDNFVSLVKLERKKIPPARSPKPGTIHRTEKSIQGTPKIVSPNVKNPKKNIPRTSSISYPAQASFTPQSTSKDKRRGLHPLIKLLTQSRSQDPKALKTSLRLKAPSVAGRLKLKQRASNQQQISELILFKVYSYLSIVQIVNLGFCSKKFSDSTQRARNKGFMSFLINSPNGALSDQVRVAYWLRKSDVTRTMKDHPKVYKRLQIARKQLTNEALSTIERDLERTFPHNAYFQAGNEGHAQLQRVLGAFAAHNPTVGYIQGLNFIAGNFLLLLNQEESFWMLHNLCHRYNLLQMYSEGMLRLKICLYQLSCFMHLYLPQIYVHLKAQGLSISTYAPQWFLTLFSYDIQQRSTLYKIWNLFLMKRWKVLIRTALGILKLCESELLSSSHDDCLYALKRFGQDKQQQLLGSGFKVTNRFLGQMEQCYLLSVEQKLNPPQMLAVNGNQLRVLPAPPEDPKQRRLSAASAWEGLRQSVFPQQSLDEHIAMLRRQARKRSSLVKLQARTSSAHPEHNRKSGGARRQRFKESTSLEENLSQSESELRPRQSKYFVTHSPTLEIQNKPPSMLNFNQISRSLLLTSHRRVFKTTASKPKMISRQSALEQTPPQQHDEPSVILKDRNIQNIIMEASDPDQSFFQKQSVCDSSFRDCEVAQEEQFYGFEDTISNFNLKEEADKENFTTASFSDQSSNSVLGVTNRIQQKNQRQSCPLQRHEGDADLDDDLLLSSCHLVSGELDETAHQYSLAAQGVLSRRISSFANPLTFKTKSNKPL